MSTVATGIGSFSTALDTSVGTVGLNDGGPIVPYYEGNGVSNTDLQQNIAVVGAYPIMKSITEGTYVPPGNTPVDVVDGIEHLKADAATQQTRQQHEHKSLEQAADQERQAAPAVALPEAETARGPTQDLGGKTMATGLAGTSGFSFGLSATPEGKTLATGSTFDQSSGRFDFAKGLTGSSKDALMSLGNTLSGYMNGSMLHMPEASLGTFAPSAGAQLGHGGAALAV